VDRLIRSIERILIGACAAVLVLAIALPSWALTVEQVPNPRLAKSWVADTAELISPEAEARINTAIDALQANTGTEVLVATIDRLEDESGALTDIDSYTNALFNRFGVGSKEGVDGSRGLAIVVSLEPKKWRVETGRGLEGALPDLVTAYVFKEQALPSFKNGDVGSGIAAAIAEYGKILRGELQPPPEIASKDSQQSRQQTEAAEVTGFIIAFGIMFFFIVAISAIGKVLRSPQQAQNSSEGNPSTVRKKPSRHRTSIRSSSGSSSSYLGGHSSGGSSSGGSFGGGVSDGGGASGDW